MQPVVTFICYYCCSRHLYFPVTCCCTVCAYCSLVSHYTWVHWLCLQPVCCFLLTTYAACFFFFTYIFNKSAIRLLNCSWCVISFMSNVPLNVQEAHPSHAQVILKPQIRQDYQNIYLKLHTPVMNIFFHLSQTSPNRKHHHFENKQEGYCGRPLLMESNLDISHHFP